MGYFSDIEVEYEKSNNDYSYNSPEMQLMWRLEDLRNRLKELQKAGTMYRNEDEGIHLGVEDIRYTIAEHLGCVADIELAIDLAVSDLLTKYGIDATEKGITECETIVCTPLVWRLYFDSINKAASLGLSVTVA